MLKSTEVENLLEYMKISNNPLVNKVCADILKVHETMDLYPNNGLISNLCSKL